MKTIKGKLLLWNGLLLVVVLILLEFSVYYSLKKILYQDIDTELRNEAMEINGFLHVVNNRIEFVNMHEWEEFEHQEVGANAIFFQITSFLSLNKIRSRNMELLGITLPDHPHSYKMPKNARVYSDVNANGYWLRELEMPIYRDGKQIGVLTTAMSLRNIKSFFNAILKIFMIITPFTLLVLVVGIWRLTQKALYPIEHISSVAGEIMKSQNLKHRIDIRDSAQEVQQLAGTLNSLFQRLDESIQKIKSFTANASHELRTPLTIMRGNIDVILAKERTKEQYQHTLKIILDEVKKLSRIVDNLLTLSRSDAGQTILEKNVLRLEELIESCQEELQSLIPPGEQQLHLQYERGLEILGDEAWLRELLFNLVENAVKYNRPGGEIFVRAYSENNRVCLEVRDTGFGIPEEELPKIFERFYRIDKTRLHSTEGSGLGLSIVKWIVEEHEGEIHVESQEGKGSIFRVEFPAVSYEEIAASYGKKSVRSA
ncbi:MAG: HAMP domain-containing protein [Calditrichaeota bacterium]|nr:MAG: HAMP domain-containing protein [Calditrichota bacterium]